ncbi:MAG: hypothetical protein QM526_00615 [Alphaproteobacteria bacterium]|nr:hypothetical protein [Alphaproteobacteria bacterium]
MIKKISQKPLHGEETKAVALLFVHIGILVTLIMTIIGFFLVTFGAIRYYVPDTLDSVWDTERISSSVGFGVAMLITAFSILFYLTRKVNISDPLTWGVWIARIRQAIIACAVTFSVIAIGVVAIQTIGSFLSGDLSLRFILRSIATVTLAGAVFYYYRLAWGHYWHTHRETSLRIGIVFSCIVLVLVIVGIKVVNPVQVRKYKIDNQIVTNFETIRSKVLEYYHVHANTPEEVHTIIRGLPSNVSYRKVSQSTYTVCGIFALPSQSVVNKSQFVSTESFYHSTAGEQCYVISIVQKNGEYPRDGVAPVVKQSR